MQIYALTFGIVFMYHTVWILSYLTFHCLDAELFYDSPPLSLKKCFVIYLLFQPRFNHALGLHYVSVYILQSSRVTTYPIYNDSTFITYFSQVSIWPTGKSWSGYNVLSLKRTFFRPSWGYVITRLDCTWLHRISLNKSPGVYSLNIQNLPGVKSTPATIQVSASILQRCDFTRPLYEAGFYSR